MLWTGQQDKSLKWECCQGREAFVFCSPCSSALFPAHVSNLPQCCAIWPPHSQFSMQTVIFTMTQLLASSQLTWHYSLSWQVLLVFSDGLDDSLEDLRKAADSLRFKGITVPHWCSSLLLPMVQCIAPPLQLFHITLPLHAHMAFLRSHWETLFLHVNQCTWWLVTGWQMMPETCLGVQRAWDGSGFWSPAPAAGAIQGSPSHWWVQHQRLDPTLTSAGKNSFTLLFGHWVTVWSDNWGEKLIGKLLVWIFLLHIVLNSLISFNILCWSHEM